MKSTTQKLLQQLNDPNLSIDERALLRCRIAKQFEDVGNYDAAREALGDLWGDIGEPPNLGNLNQQSAAEVLLRVGTLTGWIGSTRQIEGSQETAKDLITQSITTFESLKATKKVAEAQTEIALCYEREGEMNYARVMFEEALSRLEDQDGELKAVALLRIAVLEKLTNRLNEALHYLAIGTTLFEASNNPTLKGRFHNERANVLRRLGEIENRDDYLDRAVIEYTAASFHFEQAHHSRYQACVENNLALLYLRTNRLPDSHERLDCAEALLTPLNDVVHLAQVAETRARVMLAEGAFVQAERSARRAILLLENGDERSLLAESLTTQGIALSRLGRKDPARSAFERAIQVAEEAGDLETASLAALALVEELPECLSDEELLAILERADDRLEGTQNLDLLRRRKNCFRHLSSRLLWPDLPISLESWVHRNEARLILQALKDTGATIKQAAGLLQLSRQTLQKILKNRHKDLRPKIAEIRARKRSSSPSGNVSSGVDEKKAHGIPAAKILHVEDNQMVAEAIKETLEDIPGWQVDICADGNAALEKISSDAHYDLLLFDYDLPGLNGIELLRRARQMAHRSRTPIVMLSASVVEAASREAGADVFLHKPQDIGALAEMMTHLLGEHEKEDEAT